MSAVRPSPSPCLTRTGSHTLPDQSRSPIFLSVPTPNFTESKCACSLGAARLTQRTMTLFAFVGATALFFFLGIILFGIWQNYVQVCHLFDTPLWHTHTHTQSAAERKRQRARSRRLPSRAPSATPASRRPSPTSVASPTPAYNRVQESRYDAQVWPHHPLALSPSLASLHTHLPTADLPVDRAHAHPAVTRLHPPPLCPRRHQRLRHRLDAAVGDAHPAAASCRLRHARCGLRCGEPGAPRCLLFLCPSHVERGTGARPPPHAGRVRSLPVPSRGDVRGCVGRGHAGAQPLPPPAGGGVHRA